MQAWSNGEVQSGPTLNLFFSHPRSSFGRDQTQTSDLPFSEVLWPPVLPYHFTAPQGHVALPTKNPTYSKPTNRRLGDGPVVRSGTHNVWTQSSAMTSIQSSPDYHWTDAHILTTYPPARSQAEAPRVLEFYINVDNNHGFQPIIISLCRYWQLGRKRKISTYQSNLLLLPLQTHSDGYSNNNHSYH